MTSKLNTQKEMVEYLNSLRTENGKKPLRNCRAAKKEIRLWILKETDEKLKRVEAEKIEKAKAEKTEKAEAKKVEKTEKTEKTGKAKTAKKSKAKKAESKKSKAKNAEESEKTETDTDTKTITAVQLAEELGIDPKSLRRKLRKIEDLGLIPPRNDRKWVFKIEVKTTIIDLLNK